MKKFYLLFVFIITLHSTLLFANVTVTPASGGENIERFKSQNGNAPAFITIGNIVILEGAIDDIPNNQGGVTLILTAPLNWQFNTGQGSVAHIADRDITSSSIAISTTTITVTFSTANGSSGRDEIDQITISGIQVQAIDGQITNAQNIIRSSSNPGTASIAGIINNSTNFGTLSLDPNTVWPVELTSFTASVKNYSVHLNWETATEVSNYGFEIEKAAGSKELEVGSWKKIGFVKGHGNSNSPKKYSFVDSKLSFGTYFYRLKQIDTDGGFEYSKVVEVDFSVTDNFSLEQNYPNPFNPATTIKFAFDKNTKAQLKVYNVLGIEVANLFNETVEAGKIYEIIFNASQLSSGVYYYQLSGDNKTEIKKMLLLK